MKEKLYYQYLPGTSYEGEICLLTRIFTDDGEIYYEFDNGEICNKEFIADFTLNERDLQNKVMVQLSSRNDKWEFKDMFQMTNDALLNVSSSDGTEFIAPDYGSYTANNSFMKKKLIAPKTIIRNMPSPSYEDYMSYDDLIALGITPKIKKPEPVKTEKIENTIDTKEQDVNIPQTSEKIVTKNENINNKINSNDPVAILVNAASKLPVDVNMTLSINLPSKSIFNIVNENFQNGINTFIDVILSDIDYDVIKNSLRQALLNEYQQNNPFKYKGFMDKNGNRGDLYFVISLK